MRPGDVIAERFEIEREAGSGGMSIVFRARDRLSGEPVALKVLRASSEDYERRFAVEARALAALVHPGIVRYIAHGPIEGGEAYLAMEWLEGETLGDRLARAPLSVAETVRLISRIADALGVAHQRKIVHRDVKPRNLFLIDGDLERIKLLDFGIARFTSMASMVTSPGVAVGTPAYMSPEQARGVREIDARSDVFALGCVMFKCLTGRTPAVGDDAMAMMAKIILEEPPAVSDLLPGVPEPVSRLVAQLLSKDPMGRPHDGIAVVQALALLDESTFPDSGLRVAMSASGSSRTLTRDERDLVSVVVRAAPEPGAAVSMADISISVSGLADASSADLERIRAVLGATAARVEWLVDGSLVVAIRGRGNAADQAACAARCSMVLARESPGSRLALATGRAASNASLPVGEVIDRAFRILRMAAPSDPGASTPVCIDDTTASLLESRFEIVRGPEIVSLQRERDRSAPGRTLLGRPTPCVGRERELSTLDAIVSEVVSEPVARAVLLSAPAGVGKSRVRHEFVRRLEKRGEIIEIWHGRGDPMSVGSPFGMIAPALRETAGILEGEPHATRQRKLRDRVARNVPADVLERVTEFIGELVGVPFPDEGSAQLRSARRDPVLMGDQMRRAWEDLVSAECAAQPLLIVLEDLHWGDLPSVKFIDSLLRNLRDRPLMILAVARPDVHESFPGLWAERELQEMRIGALTPRSGEKLVRDVLGDVVSADTVARVVERAGGNAFYLEELIRAVAEGKGDALPETVLAMVQARVETLESEARRVLRAASVFGQVYWRSGLQLLLGTGDKSADLDGWLSVLVERELITERGDGKFPGDREYGFRHALVREAAYAMLTDRDRVLGHRLAGSWLERAGERDSMVLADHFERGEEPLRAVEGYLQGARVALAGNDAEAALRRARKVEACGATGAALGFSKLVMAEVLHWQGDAKEEGVCARAAMELLPSASAGWFTAIGHLAGSCMRLGEHSIVASLADSLCKLEVEVEGDDARAAHAAALATVSVRLIQAGSYEHARATLARMEEAAAAITRDDPLVSGRVAEAKSWEASLSGNMASSLRLSEESMRHFEAAGNLRAACNQQINVGDACKELGEYARAESVLRGALATAESMGLKLPTAIASQNLGYVLAHRGNHGEAIACGRRALELYRGQGDQRVLGAASSYLASSLMFAGDLEAAETLARGAVELLAEAPPYRAVALATLATVMLRRGRSAEALATSRDSLAVLETLGRAEEGESLAWLTFAQALDAEGDRAGATGAIATARERVLAQAARYGDDPLRKSFLASVPENARILELAAQWLGVDPATP